MGIRAIWVLLLPWTSWASEPPECARAWVSSDYGHFVLSLRAGEPEVLSLGAGRRLALLAAPECPSDRVKISTEAVSGSSRLSTILLVGQDKPASVTFAGLTLEVRLTPQHRQAPSADGVEHNSR